MSLHSPHHQNLQRDSVYDILKRGDGEIKIVDMASGTMNTILINRYGIEAMNDEYWGREGVRELETITEKMANAFLPNSANDEVYNMVA